jgi:hypothetical protein
MIFYDKGMIYNQRILLGLRSKSLNHPRLLINLKPSLHNPFPHMENSPYNAINHVLLGNLFIFRTIEWRWFIMNRGWGFNPLKDVDAANPLTNQLQVAKSHGPLKYIWIIHACMCIPLSRWFKIHIQPIFHPIY